MAAPKNAITQGLKHSQKQFILGRSTCNYERKVWCIAKKSMLYYIPYVCQKITIPMNDIHNIHWHWHTGTIHLYSMNQVYVERYHCIYIYKHIVCTVRDMIISCTASQVSPLSRNCWSLGQAMETSFNASAATPWRQQRIYPPGNESISHISHHPGKWKGKSSSKLPGGNMLVPRRLITVLAGILWHVWKV